MAAVPTPRPRAVWVSLTAAMIAAVLYPRPLGATVEEQRARLPPAAECPDPIEGVWLSHKFEPSWGEWYIYTLKVKRAAPGSTDLTGEIESHYWNGGPGDAQPPPCRPGMFRYVVHMPAKGTYLNESIQFGGLSWRADPPLCPGAGGMGYNPDNFTGKIDKKTQEFQSLNNDGGKAVNDPTVFRRVRCLEEPPPQGVKATPPPFEPPRRLFRCGK